MKFLLHKSMIFEQSILKYCLHDEHELQDWKNMTSDHSVIFLLKSVAPANSTLLVFMKKVVL